MSLKNKLNPKIRRIKEKDLASVAKVHKDAFARQDHSKKWINCNYQAFPIMQYFVAEDNGEIIGYILWAQKSGFRKDKNAVLELAQIAVHPNHQGKGIGQSLIMESLSVVEKDLVKKGTTIKNIIVTTRADNHSQRLYKKTLKAEVEATIKDLFSADEVIMVSRRKK
jgi:ribosomal protein S18 acetylase RimI-like enzyme